ncbi:hypothetical protein ACS35N_004484 [Enterobacter hormaechei]
MIAGLIVILHALSADAFAGDTNTLSTIISWQSSAPDITHLKDFRLPEATRTASHTKTRPATKRKKRIINTSSNQEVAGSSHKAGKENIPARSLPVKPGIPPDKPVAVQPGPNLDPGACLSLTEKMKKKISELTDNNLLLNSRIKEQNREMDALKRKNEALSQQVEYLNTHNAAELQKKTQ